MSWRIFIPSKGRPNSKLFKMLPQATLVVEPTDYFAYREANPDAQIVQLAMNNQGIAYVRNQILDYTRFDGDRWFWMLDDDISGFAETLNQRLVAKNASEVLSEAEMLISAQSGVGQAALEYAQFAWSAKTPFKWNSYCDVCVAINVAYTRELRYRADFNLKEDRDFTLQVLKSGARTLRLSQLSFKAPKNGSNKGGLYDEYAAKTREREAVDRMVSHWGPSICAPQTKADGRYDLKINWRHFKFQT